MEANDASPGQGNWTFGTRLSSLQRPKLLAGNRGGHERAGRKILGPLPRASGSDRNSHFVGEAYGRFAAMGLRRRALVLRDRGCCFPGCTHTRFLHGHHWRHWLHGGETSLANLLLLCPFHHGLVHEGGWSVEGRGGRARAGDRHRSTNEPLWDGSALDYDVAVSGLVAG